MNKLFRSAAADIPASIVVFLVALPLCLGVALASNAPLFAGIIAGVVGGIVVGLLSGSSLSVSGPAAGLTAIVATAIGKMPIYEAFLLSVVIAGALQVIMGFLKLGVIGDYVPNAVIKGMLAAIGIILILKQFPHLVGYDADAEGDESFLQPNDENTFSGIWHGINYIAPAAVIIGTVSLFVLYVWELPAIKKIKLMQLVPAPLVVVSLGIGINAIFASNGSTLTLDDGHLVTLPVAKSFNEFFGFLNFPELQYLTNPEVWKAGLTIAIVASLETLLGVEAVDKLDPLNRVTPTNKELKAQGVGNMVSGLLGGIPVTSVIVRSSANVNAGAKSKVSTIMHGILMLLFVAFLPVLLNKIPLSALAAILIFTGYKLARVTLFREFYKKGWDQFAPFVITIVSILLTDLLIGILIGLMVGLFFLVRSNFKSSLMVVNDTQNWLFRLRKDVSFLNKPILKRKLEEVPPNSSVLIDVTRADFIDKDIVDVMNEFIHHAHLKNIRVEMKKSENNSTHKLFRNVVVQVPELSMED